MDIHIYIYVYMCICVCIWSPPIYKYYMCYIYMNKQDKA